MVHSYILDGSFHEDIGKIKIHTNKSSWIPKLVRVTLLLNNLDQINSKTFLNLQSH